MTLPLSRDETLVAGTTTVKANLLNSLQDMIIGAKHGSVVVPWAAAQAAIESTWTRTATGFISCVNTGKAYVSLYAPVGTKITAVTISGVESAAGASFSGELFKVNMATGARVSKSDKVSSAADGTIQTIALTNVVEEVIAETEYWQIELDNAGITSNTVYGGTITLQLE